MSKKLTAILAVIAVATIAAPVYAAAPSMATIQQELSSIQATLTNLEIEAGMSTPLAAVVDHSPVRVLANFIWVVV
jgi:hypothetical protein